MEAVKQGKSSFKCFQKYIKFELINENELKLAIDYICGNLNGDYTNNYPY